MEINNIWSQGQLFAFSGLEGETAFNSDFTGILCGDKIGIKFYTKTRRELSVTSIKTNDLKFTAVTGDFICANLGHGKSLKILFYKRNIIAGFIDEESYISLICQGEHTLHTDNNITIHDTLDGEFTALAKKGNMFSLSFGTSLEEVTLAAKEGLCAPIDDIIDKRLAFYKKHLHGGEYDRLKAKCISVMRTQLYSPEGRFSHLWSTPDRLPHKSLWFWDSIFHAIGFSNIDPYISQQLILSLVATQREDGMIPHMSNTNLSSEITQPPVLSWGALKIYSITKDKDFLRTCFEANRRFLSWCNENRKANDKWLYSWNTTADINCRCDESGMDNSPRFDKSGILQTIDFSCFMANEMRIMAHIAKELGTDGSQFEHSFEKIRDDINNTLWDDNDGFYYDYNLTENKLHKVATVSSFLPLFSGVCDDKKAALLVKELNNPLTFATKCPIPCLAKNEKEFGTDMWRGPFWINYNYMITEGLYSYGYTSLAHEIRQKTIEEVNRQYIDSGTIYEFYDSNGEKSPSKLNRKGAVIEPYDFDIRYQSIRDYGWSACLMLDMIETEEDK